VARRADLAARRPWRAELVEGVRWLWRNQLLRTMAVVLGLLNASASITFAVYVLFAQEVLGASTVQFALIMMAGAAGAVIGGWTASALTRALGSGPVLTLALAGTAVVEMTIGFLSSVPVVAVMNLAGALLAVLWNVVTVSLRQAIIPDRLLGRVNSVYRFFAWGMIPVGAAIGGVIVAVVAAFGDRELALRVPWVVAGGIDVALLVYAAPRLTTARMDAARAATVASARSR
jgi:Na+/melibiose symporter-like transporter